MRAGQEETEMKGKITYTLNVSFDYSDTLTCVASDNRIRTVAGFRRAFNLENLAGGQRVTYAEVERHYDTDDYDVVSSDEEGWENS